MMCKGEGVRPIYHALSDGEGAIQRCYVVISTVVDKKVAALMFLRTRTIFVQNLSSFPIFSHSIFESLSEIEVLEIASIGWE